MPTTSQHLQVIKLQDIPKNINFVLVKTLQPSGQIYEIAKKAHFETL